MCDFQNNAMDWNMNEHPQGSPREGWDEISIKTDQLETNQALYPQKMQKYMRVRKDTEKKKSFDIVV